MPVPHPSTLAATPRPAHRSPARRSSPHDSPVKPRLSDAGRKTILDLETWVEGVKV